MKKFFYGILLLTIILTGVQTGTESASASSNVQGEIINLEGVDLTKPHVVTKDGTTIDSVTYDEMVAGIAKRDGLSIDQVKKRLADGDVKRPLLKASSSTFYKHLTKTIDIGGLWKPKIDIYVKMWAQGSFRQFDKIIDYNLVRSWYGASKQFKGSFKVKFLSKNNIYWCINGDFYDKGTTSSSSSVSLSVGGVGSVNYSVSKAKTKYKYVYKYGHFYAQ
ncbi:hypothetical protein [Listeria fleischmannii]|jgi:hypothetical protein|uniref:Uncharacterized protein n=1 Tax=Listeria fleischmannii TaxID=1069827 RepID=A0A841YE63_9LIST|nr:hypothetical protein [Listeria fleischmannii]EIA18836.1 hypothetical protein KKC_15730 [Listeria fleischmannii subsp. coloradonensis]MBC1398549.1 hypothetical protein [Listeria fleischmannii]MBC1426610.1 hypothetical protein [Listeria fleischmannii]STY46474.1 Uncharacterised protein [Listeria fleischmannii subsp. coloradonensis]